MLFSALLVTISHRSDYNLLNRPMNIKAVDLGQVSKLYVGQRPHLAYISIMAYYVHSSLSSFPPPHMSSRYTHNMSAASSLCSLRQKDEMRFILFSTFTHSCTSMQNVPFPPCADRNPSHPLGSPPQSTACPVLSGLNKIQELTDKQLNSPPLS